MTSRNLVTTGLKELKIKFLKVKEGQDREISEYHYNPLRGPVSRKGFLLFVYSRKHKGHLPNEWVSCAM